MNNTAEKFRVNFDVIEITGAINPKTGMKIVRVIPITSPLHPSYSVYVDSKKKPIESPLRYC